ncbi:GPI anchored serine-threonine rich family protein [Streptomyces sp. NPDC093094]|uniref:GPI anchored serine-threonine rich family protein n=1 Tax=Streptomyces sp. NPDC093094 TaxID=3366026 RepID=UPI0037FC0F8E
MPPSAWSTPPPPVSPGPCPPSQPPDSPITNAQWEAGKTYAIIWSDAAPGAQPLNLMKERATALQQVLQIAIVEGTDGLCEWGVPADLPTGSDYAIALGTPPDTGYTGLFTIAGSASPDPEPVPTPR